MPSTITPNMSLVVPTVGQEPGPQYATDINGDMSIIDNHNHTPGYGVPIPAAAINYNADLSAMDNRLLLAKSVTFTAQGSPLSGITPDIGALYVSGVDLYYNDISGNQVRITQNGGVTGTPGSISGLTPPASASYVGLSQEFVWQSGVGISAGMDNGPVTIRENIFNAKGITIQSPHLLAADYSLTLPAALPGSTKFLTIDSSGNINDNIAYPLTKADQAAVGQQVSSSCGTYNVNNSPAAVTNLTVTITTSGRPVMLMLQPDATTNQAAVTLSATSGGANANLNIYIERDASVDFNQTFWQIIGASAPAFFPLSMSCLDAPIAGTHTYKLWAYYGGTGPTGIQILNAVLVAYEL